MRDVGAMVEWQAQREEEEREWGKERIEGGSEGQEQAGNWMFPDLGGGPSIRLYVSRTIQY